MPGIGGGSYGGSLSSGGQSMLALVDGSADHVTVRLPLGSRSRSTVKVPAVFTGVCMTHSLRAVNARSPYCAGAVPFQRVVLPGTALVGTET